MSGLYDEPSRGPCFNPECPACVAQRLHTEQEHRYHPLMGHGFSPETGWTHPEAKAAHYRDRDAAANKAKK